MADVNPPMDASKVHPATLERLSELSPEKRTIIERYLAKRQTPEYRERERVLREKLENEYRQTGTIATKGSTTNPFSLGRPAPPEEGG